MCCSSGWPSICHSSCFAAQKLRRLHPSPLYLTSTINNSAKECTELKIEGEVWRGAVDGFSMAPSICLPPFTPVLLPHFPTWPSAMLFIILYSMDKKHTSFCRVHYRDRNIAKCLVEVLLKSYWKTYVQYIVFLFAIYVVHTCSY